MGSPWDVVRQLGRSLRLLAACYSTSWPFVTSTTGRVVGVPGRAVAEEFVLMAGICSAP